jgi:hypothetical protein
VAAARQKLAKKGEVYFCFAINKFDLVNNHLLTNKLALIISFDHFKNGIGYAYADKKEFEKFLGYNIDFTVLPHPGELYHSSSYKMTASADSVSLNWNIYPTYPAYVTMMTAFETAYPGYCKIIRFGTTVKNRKLLYAKITSDIGVTGKKPRFMYSSTMHGNETTFYVNMLRMINYLLTNYSTDAYVKKLVDSVEIWICPLENPDGTYASGDSTVRGATRGNANSIDLNRNYPDFVAGPHPDNETSYQPECTALMNILDTFHFVMSANYHNGEELLNYPWDSKSELHPDDAWMQYVYKKYADTVHAINPSYMISEDTTGIINGYAWYYAAGTRQDYITHSKFGREVTVETSNTQLLPSADLPAYWNYNYKSMLQLIEQTLYGINGTVVDSITKTGLRAKVFVDNHDSESDSSFTMSDSSGGNYYRPIFQGTYSVTYSCSGYKSKTVAGVSVVNNNASVVNVELCPAGINTVKTATPQPFADFYITNFNNGLKIFNASGIAEAVIYNINGKAVRRLLGKAPEIVWNGADDNGNIVSNGFYTIKITSAKGALVKGFVFSPK